MNNTNTTGSKKLWTVEYRPILSNSTRFGNFYEADHTNTTTLEAKSAKQAKQFFHEGNHGVVVCVVEA